MAEQMTLEQVRDGLRSFSSALAKLDAYAWSTKCSSWADAIDAYINAAKGEVVAFRIEDKQGKWILVWDKRTADALADCGAKVTRFYTHQASPDVVRDAARYRKVKQLTKEQYLTWRGMFGCSDESLDEAAIAARENES